MKEPNRIHIIHLVLGKANPSRMNGVNKVVFELLNAQKKLGANVELWGITPSPNGQSVHSEIRTRFFNSKAGTKTLLFAIEKELNSLKGSFLFHLHGGFIPSFFKLSKLLSEKNIPFILTPHGSYNKVAMQRNRLKKRIYFSLFEKKIIGRAKSIHCIGKSEKKALKDLLPSVNTFLVPNGYDLIENSPKPLSSPVLNFCFCGRLDLYTKGIDILLKGFESYLKKGGMGNLRLIGDGKDRTKVNQLISDKWQDRIIKYGAMFDEAKLTLLAECQSFILCSRNEGMPMGVLEALGMGIPVIISQETNLGDYVKKGNCGVVLLENNDNNLENALFEIEQQWKEQKLNTFRINAKKLVQKRFSWTNIAKALQENYVLALKP